MERCIASDEILVSSQTNTKKYTVSFRDVLPTCTCVAFAIGRNRMVSTRSDIRTSGPQLAHCKHLDAVIESGICRWRGIPVIPHLCPQCGSRTEPCDDTVNLF